ncbi:MAG TPA: DUF3617 family protein [Methylomirabilota bacterium]|jgi:hypothetical protein
MTARTVAIASLTAALCATSGATTSSSDQWPELRPGIWKIEIRSQTPTDKRASVSRSEERQCTNPALLFQRYPRPAVVDKTGCRFDSLRVDFGRYEVMNTCALRGKGQGVVIGTIEMSGSERFESVWEVRENGKQVLLEELKGEWLRPCGG